MVNYNLRKKQTKNDYINKMYIKMSIVKYRNYSGILFLVIKILRSKDTYEK